jgi:hypothetical protein
MKLVIQGDKIAALVGDDFPTTDMLVDVPDGFDINQAHRYRYDGSQIVRGCLKKSLPVRRCRR